MYSGFCIIWTKFSTLAYYFCYIFIFFLLLSHIFLLQLIFMIFLWDLRRILRRCLLCYIRKKIATSVLWFCYNSVDFCYTIFAEVVSGEVGSATLAQLVCYQRFAVLLQYRSIFATRSSVRSTGESLRRVSDEVEYATLAQLSCYTVSGDISGEISYEVQSNFLFFRPNLFLLHVAKAGLVVAKRDFL